MDKNIFFFLLILTVLISCGTNKNDTMESIRFECDDDDTTLFITLDHEIKLFGIALYQDLNEDGDLIQDELLSGEYWYGQDLYEDSNQLSLRIRDSELFTNTEYIFWLATEDYSITTWKISFNNKKNREIEKIRNDFLIEAKWIDSDSH